MASGETATLERYIEASVERLLSGQYSSQNGLILLSSWQEAMPALVHLDPVLEPVDSRVFAVLWIWARQEGRSGTAFPTYDTLLQRCNIQSRRTVARSLAILRITRWVTLCRRVRDPAGRHRGNIYTLHDEPLVLPSTLHLDPGYVDFLDTAKTHNHPYVREVARGMWASLEGRIAEGEDVVSASPVSQTDQRLEALSTLAGEGSGNYFGFRRGALSGLHIWREKRVPNNSPTDPVQKVNSVQVHFLNSALCSSSYLNKTTTTTGDENNSAAEPDTQPAEGDLIFPDQLSSSEQRLAEMYLRHFEHDIQQALLDELSEKIRSQAKTHHPVRNPVGLLAWMCKQTRAGEPPLTSAHLKCRERRERERHVKESIEAEQRRLTDLALAAGYDRKPASVPREPAKT